jgi:hypothetical protein
VKETLFVDLLTAISIVPQIPAMQYMYVPDDARHTLTVPPSSVPRFLRSPDCKGTGVGTLLSPKREKITLGVLEASVVGSKTQDVRQASLRQ